MSDSERNQLHQFLFSSNGAFRGDSFNDLSDLDALVQAGEKPTDPFSKERKKQDAQTPDPNATVDVMSIAGLAGMDKIGKDEIAKKFGVWDSKTNSIKSNTNIPIADAKKILAQQPADSPYQEAFRQIQEYINGQVNSKEKAAAEKEQTKELAPYERYKVIMPGSGKEVSLAEVFRAQKIDPESCLLKDAHINGRVGYIAILDTDITYGTKNSPLLQGNQVSPATGKPNAELTSVRGGETINQHVYGQSVVGYLNLNGGGNLIVPEFYRDWIVFTTAYTKADFYFSMITSIAAFGAIKDLEAVKDIKQKQLQNLKTREPNPLLAAQIREQTTGVVQKDAAGRYLLKEGGIQVPGGQAASVEIDSATNTLKYYNTAGAHIAPADVAAVPDIDTALKKQPDLSFRTKGGLENDIKDAEFNIDSLRKVKGTLEGRVITSFMLAGGWLGPARMAFSLNNGILFQARSQADDKFLRLLANKEVLSDFKKASSFLAIGKIEETVAKYAGLGQTPQKAFFAKNLLFLNYPESQKTPNYESSTVLRSEDDGTIGINTRWRGGAYTLNYEDMRAFADKQGPESFTSLAMVSNNILAEPALEDKNLKSLTAFFSVAVPFIVTRKIFQLQERTLGAGIFLTTLEYLDINENYAKDVQCNIDEYNDLKTAYRQAFTASAATTILLLSRSFLTPFRKFLQTTDFGKSLGAGILNVLDYTNPGDAWRVHVGNRGITYTSNCKDQMQTILSWQSIPERVSTTSNALADKLPAVNDQLSKIGLSKVLGANAEAAQTEAKIKNLKDVLNLRAVTQNQGGFVRTPELLYLHIDQSTSMTKGALYDLVNNACGLQDRIQSKDGRSLSFGEGLEANNADGSKALSFKSAIWKLRALANNKVQALGRIIIPNTIIQSNLMGGTDAFVEIASTGQSTLVNPPCDLTSAIRQLTGRDIGTDLTQAIGKVRTVETSEGQAGLLDGQIDYVGRNGVGASVPTPEDLRKSIISGGRISVRNNGQAVLYGATGNSQQPIGTLKSIIGDSGALHYDQPTGQISLIIYSIFETSNQNIQNYNLDTRGSGAQIQVQAKRGFEDSANKLNAGLDKIAGKDGITSFETKDHIYYITPDGKLRVIDKNTGKATDYNITGPITKDGNGNLVIPTDKGDFKLNLTNENGQPTLNAEGPDGLKEVLALLAARGENGIMTFNPSTGAINVYNGQDVPLNPAFAQNGIGFSGNKDGTTSGVPADSPFFAPSSSSSTTTDSAPPKLFLPSWPEELPWAALFAGLILFGVVAIRYRKVG